MFDSIVVVTDRRVLALDLAAPDFRPLQEAIRAEFRGRDWVTIEEVENFVASDRTDYYTGQLRKGGLVPLEQAGLIEVAKGTRRKARTYPPGTQLRVT